MAAANTFYVANPDHTEMRQNLEYYSLMAGVQDTDFKDLEARPHMVRSQNGVKKCAGFVLLGVKIMTCMMGCFRLSF